MQPIQYMTTIGAAFITVLCIWSFAAMGPSTKHCFRAVYGVTGTAAFGIVAIMFSKTEYLWLRPWFDCAMVWSFVLIMALNRRRIVKRS